MAGKASNSPVAASGEVPLTDSPQEGSERLLVLNLGSGKMNVPNETYPPEQWREIRVDFDPEVKPDIEADLRHLPFPDDYADSVWASHVLEHFTELEANTILEEWRRVLKPNGSIVVVVPNLVCEKMRQAFQREDLGQPIYQSPAGTVVATDMLFGMFKIGPGMAHKWGYTPASLLALVRRYFRTATIMDAGDINATVVAYKEAR